MIAIPKHSHHNRFKWFMKGRQTGNQIPLPPKKISLSLSANRKDYTCLHGPYQGPLRDIFPKDRTTDHTKNKTEYPHCQRAYVPIYLNHKPPSIHIPKKLNPIAPPPPQNKSAIQSLPFNRIIRIPKTNAHQTSHQAQSSKSHALPPPPLPHCWRRPFNKTSISTPSPSSSPFHRPQPRDQPTLQRPRPASCSGAISPPDCRCLPNRR